MMPGMKLQDFLNLTKLREKATTFNPRVHYGDDNYTLWT